MDQSIQKAVWPTQLYGARDGEPVNIHSGMLPCLLIVIPWRRRGGGEEEGKVGGGRGCKEGSNRRSHYDVGERSYDVFLGVTSDPFDQSQFYLFLFVCCFLLLPPRRSLQWKSLWTSSHAR